MALSSNDIDNSHKSYSKKYLTRKNHKIHNANGRLDRTIDQLSKATDVKSHTHLKTRTRLLETLHIYIYIYIYRHRHDM